MRFVFVSYINTPQFDRPEDWIERIRGYTGILEALSTTDTVISIEQIHYQGILERKGVTYHFLDFGRKQKRFPFRLNRSVKNCKPDIVIVHGMHFPLQIMQLRMTLGRSARIIVQNHAEKPGLRHKKILQQIADRSIDAYLFTAKSMGDEWIRQGIIREPGKIREVMEASSVFSPMDKPHAKNTTGVSGDPVFLWVGRLDKNKDPLTVVTAFLRFAGSCPSARLYMLYHTEDLLPELKELLERYRMEGKADFDPVVLVGQKPHTEMADWFNSADYIVSGSHYEGSGVAVCEAMSCGCIPVVTDIQSFRMITGNGDCGILYTPGNEISLGEAFSAILSKNLKEERDKTLRRFRDHLSFEAIAKGIHQVVVSL